MSKLTEDQKKERIKKIFEMRGDGKTLSEIGVIFGVSSGMISAIIARENRDRAKKRLLHEHLHDSLSVKSRVDERHNNVLLIGAESAIKNYINSVLSNVTKKTNSNITDVSFRLSKDGQSIKEVLITLEDE